MEKTQRLHVRDFGPIESCDVEIQRLTVMTGPQASGKSTLAKLIYFFKLAQQYIQSQPLSSVQADKWLRSVFLRMFGDVTELSDTMQIRYDLQMDNGWMSPKGLILRHILRRYYSVSAVISANQRRRWRQSISPQAAA